MKTLSYWANAHPQTARLLIFISHILLGINGLFLGKWLEVEHFNLPKSFQLLALFLAAIGFLLYPVQSFYQKEEKIQYFRAKRSMDITLVCSAFLLFIFIGNHFAAYPFPLEFPSVYAATPQNHAILGASPSPIFAAPAPAFLLKIAQLGLGWKIVLSIAALGLAFVFLVIIFGMGCSIGCAGFSTAASIFMLGGLAFLIAGLVMAAHHIFGNRPPSKKGLLLRKITGISAIAGLIALTSTAIFYLTVSMGTPIIVPFLFLLLLFAAIFYVVEQFKGADK